MRDWQRKVRDYLGRAKWTQTRLANRGRISLRTVESWLADESSGWHRPPTYFAMVGVLQVLRLQCAVNAANELKRAAKPAQRGERLYASVDWSKRNVDIARELGVSPESIRVARMKRAPVKHRRKP